MRKVVNTLNSIALHDLSSTFISPLLDIFIAAKMESSSVSSCSLLISLNSRSKQVITTAFNVKLPKAETFGQICDDAVSGTPLTALRKARANFHLQTAIIASGSYSVPQITVPPKIKKLFKTYLYEKLFDNEEIWKALGRYPFTRKIFHENFKKDNSPLYVCPYCDLDTINSAGTYIIEHFLPKSKFPLLSLDPNNLFTACHGCNTPAGGKGVKVVSAVTSPYVDEVGKLVKFEFLAAKKKLNIAAPSGNLEVDGLLNLLNLSTRYSTGDTWSLFDARRNALIETVQGRGELSDKELLGYVRTQQTGVPLTYALTSWVEQDYMPLHRTIKGKLRF